MEVNVGELSHHAQRPTVAVKFFNLNVEIELFENLFMLHVEFTHFGTSYGT